MTTLFRWISAVFLVSAVGAVGTLLVFDAWNQLHFTDIHRGAGALSFLLIGASYIGLQLSLSRPPKETVKGVLLGLAFLFWGAEQFLPPSPFVTAIDTAVVLIFVTDLSFIIVGRLQERKHD
jgi:hypothetical protein